MGQWGVGGQSIHKQPYDSKETAVARWPQACLRRRSHVRAVGTDGPLESTVENTWCAAVPFTSFKHLLGASSSLYLLVHVRLDE